jgi:hypothetical protein
MLVAAVSVNNFTLLRDTLALLSDKEKYIEFLRGRLMHAWSASYSSVMKDEQDILKTIADIATLKASAARLRKAILASSPPSGTFHDRLAESLPTESPEALADPKPAS